MGPEGCEYCDRYHLQMKCLRYQPNRVGLMQAAIPPQYKSMKRGQQTEGNLQDRKREEHWARDWKQAMEGNLPEVEGPGQAQENL